MQGKLYLASLTLSAPSHFSWAFDWGASGVHVLRTSEELKVMKCMRLTLLDERGLCHQAAT
eukprot:1734863-Pleurochrysis_carterae.AAC.6